MTDFEAKALRLEAFRARRAERICMMRLIDNKTFKEIADIEGITLKSAKRIYFEAAQHLSMICEPQKKS